MKKCLLVILVFVQFSIFQSNSQGIAFTDPAKAFNKMILDKNGEGSNLERVGTYKVKGTSLYFGGSLKGTIYTKYKQFVDNCFEACPRCALHAATLGFEHPTTGKHMSFDSPLPADMEAAITKWRNYKSAAHKLEE